MAEVAAAGLGMSISGLAGAFGQALSSLSDFASKIISMLIDAARKMVQWYMNLMAKDPGAAIALALVMIYWLMPEV